jgi:hypothetical protein
VTSDDPVPAALRVAAVFEKLGIAYWLAGSLASSIHGEPRSSHDVDFVADLALDQVGGLVRALEGEYFVDEMFVREAVRGRDAFQLVARTGSSSCSARTRARSVRIARSARSAAAARSCAGATAAIARHVAKSSKARRMSARWRAYTMG